MIKKIDREYASQLLKKKGLKMNFYGSIDFIEDSYTHSLGYLADQKSTSLFRISENILKWAGDSEVYLLNFDESSIVDGFNNEYISNLLCCTETIDFNKEKAILIDVKKLNTPRKTSTLFSLIFYLIAIECHCYILPFNEQNKFIAIQDGEVILNQNNSCDFEFPPTI